MSKVKYWQCEDCGFVVYPLEAKYSKFKILEYCPRCKAYPQPFKQIMEEELPFKSITDNNTSTTVDIGKIIREKI